MNGEYRWSYMRNTNSQYKPRKKNVIKRNEGKHDDRWQKRTMDRTVKKLITNMKSE